MQHDRNPASSLSSPLSIEPHPDHVQEPEEGESIAEIDPLAKSPTKNPLRLLGRMLNRQLMTPLVLEVKSCCYMDKKNQASEGPCISPRAIILTGLSSPL